MQTGPNPVISYVWGLCDTETAKNIKDMHIFTQRV